MKLIAEFPPDEPIIDMLKHLDKIYVATSKGIYELTEDDTLTPLELEDTGGRE